ncbi:MAG: DNA recombination protein RmuC [Rhodocyclaceae bacterium]|nr:DNA recombination protein RmuC [Rhodocyclaceae bacterium]
MFSLLSAAMLGLVLVLLVVLLLRRPADHGGQLAIMGERLGRLEEGMQQAVRELAEARGRLAGFDDAQAKTREAVAALQSDLALKLADGLRAVGDTIRATVAAQVVPELQAFKADAVERSDRGFAAIDHRLQGGLAAINEIVVQMRDETGQYRQELTAATAAMRTEVSTALNELKAAVDKALKEELGTMRAENGAKLEEMRRTVDEKLHATLEQRLGESFKLVSDRLEQVHRGLGEMQTLAAGVGDLKKVLTNVKTRGTWGEVQLEALLDQILTPEQYGKNVATRPGSAARVEFAIRLPGREEGAPVWLPIDAKFPMEDYQRLVEAQERVDLAGIDEAGRALENRIKAEARTIREKYIEAPHTTDFAILYLPTEGLYAEVLRRPGLADTVQRDSKINVAGPTTLAAMLNSLQMGFRTLAIEKRSSEVWTVLGAVKTEFGKFGEALAHTKKKLEEAHNSIDKTVTRSRVLTRKLSGIDAMPALEAALVLDGPAAAAGGDGGEALSDDAAAITGIEA